MQRIPMPLEAAAYNATAQWKLKGLAINASGDGRSIQVNVSVTLGSADDARAFAGLIKTALVPIFEIYAES